MRMHQGSVLSPFCFAVVVDVIAFTRDGVLNEFIYCYDTIYILQNFVK